MRHLPSPWWACHGSISIPWGVASLVGYIYTPSLPDGTISTFFHGQHKMKLMESKAFSDSGPVTFYVSSEKPSWVTWIKVPITIKARNRGATEGKERHTHTVEHTQRTCSMALFNIDVKFLLRKLGCVIIHVSDSNVENQGFVHHFPCGSIHSIKVNLGSREVCKQCGWVYQRALIKEPLMPRCVVQFQGPASAPRSPSTGSRRSAMWRFGGKPQSLSRSDLVSPFE